MSPSEYVCDRCGLPLQQTARGFRHAANAATKAGSCGLPPEPRRRAAFPLRPGIPVTVWRPAGTVTVDGLAFRQRLKPTSFDRQLGAVITLTRGGLAQAQMVLRRAETAGDGSGVILHYEVVEEGAT